MENSNQHKKIIANFLIKIKVAKTEGEIFENGIPVITGINTKNPLSLIVMFCASLPLIFTFQFKTLRLMWLETEYFQKK